MVVLASMNLAIMLANIRNWFLHAVKGTYTFLTTDFRHKLASHFTYLLITAMENVVRLLVYQRNLAKQTGKGL